MQPINLKSILTAGMLIIILSACSSNAADNKDALPALPLSALGVDVFIASEKPLHKSETVAGSIVPNRSVDIMSELSKKISMVSFKDGSVVRKGQLLYKLDDADIRARLRQLQAELHLARINESRLSELLKTETVRREDYDIALSKLQSLQAGKEILQVDLSKTAITAPFSGTIGISKVFTGTLVHPGMPLVNLQEEGIYKLLFSVSEKYLPLVKKGTSIQFSTALDSTIMTATVVSTEPSVDMQSRNITVQATTGNHGGKLKPGMSAKIYFNTAGKTGKGIMIPTEALMPGANGYNVFVVHNSQAKITPVTVSYRNEQEALIASGLNNGDTVMISNQLRAADGVAVKIMSTKN